MILVYQVVNWTSHEVIEEFETEESMEYWMENNCEWFSDGCYLIDSTTKIYTQRA